jgi:DNA-binding NarL/FixJ family response regulator
MIDNSEERAAPGLLVTADLIFSTKISGTARAMGLQVQVVAAPSAAVERMRQCAARCVFLDLSVPGLTPEVMRELASAGVAVVAFGSHVDTDRLQAARDAGCTEVMPRSRLAAMLPELLQRYLGPA